MPLCSHFAENHFLLVSAAQFRINCMMDETFNLEHLNIFLCDAALFLSVDPDKIRDQF